MGRTVTSRESACTQRYEQDITLKIGEYAREQQDNANGASQHQREKFNVKKGARNIVNNALKRSIADAYTAYVGQVDLLPTDSYGMALYALDRAYCPDLRNPGEHDIHLQASPFVSSKAKHAAICNTAKHILETLDGYEHKVFPICPPPLRGLSSRPAIPEEHPHAAPIRHEVDQHKLKPGKHHIGIPATKQRMCRDDDADARMYAREQARHHRQQHQHQQVDPRSTSHKAQQQRTQTKESGHDRGTGCTTPCSTKPPLPISVQVVNAAAVHRTADRLRWQVGSKHVDDVLGTSTHQHERKAGAAQLQSCPVVPISKCVPGHLRVAEFYKREDRRLRSAGARGQSQAEPCRDDMPRQRRPASCYAEDDISRRVQPLLPVNASVAASLGLTVSDEQLLRLISMFQDFYLDQAESEQRAKADDAAVLQQQLQKFGMCSVNRSRRLIPTDEELDMCRRGRQQHNPAVVKVNDSMETSQAPAGPSEQQMKNTVQGDRGAMNELSPVQEDVAGLHTTTTVHVHA